MSMIHASRPRRLLGRAARTVFGSVAAVLSPDDRRIRRAYEQREAMVADRPDFTLVRGPLPEFMRRLAPARRAGPSG